MKLTNRLNRTVRAPKLTRARIFFALAVAVAADGLQIFSGFLGWTGFDQAVDLVAMLLEIWLVGFHFLFLPTFVVELVPVLEDLPTWTACALAVIALRKREERVVRQDSPAPPDKPVIEI